MGGARNVTPFEDRIFGFNWHRDRNRFNRAPRTAPKPVYGRAMRGQRAVAFYLDHQGARWTKDSPLNGINHGWGNDVYRGMGRNIGCQAVYDKGRLIDSGSELGTFDYGRPIVLWGDHLELDINKHGGSKFYTPNLTKVY
jgi:hypothetical protein